MTDRRIVLALSALALALAGAPAAQAAPVLYGATGIDANDTSPPPASNLFKIDPLTGAGTSVGQIGFPITGLATDPTTGILYAATAGVERATTPRVLLTIDTATGRPTVVGTLAGEIEDLAFDAAGNLFGWNTVGDTLAKINKATGAVTNGTSGAGRVTFGGGLAFSGANALFGLLNGDDGNMWLINAQSGFASKDRQLNGTPNKTGALLSSAEFDCKGSTLYSVVNDYGVPPTYLVTINTLNGDIVTRGVTVSALDSIAWVGCSAKDRDSTRPLVSLLTPARQKVSDLRGSGLQFKLRVNEPAKFTFTLLGRLSSKGKRGKARELATATATRTAYGEFTVTLRPNAAMRTRLRKEKKVPGLFRLTATDAAGNVTTRTKPMEFR